MEPKINSDFQVRQKRVLSCQDISCIGKCSNTVALPIVSAAGHECVFLPTALLSTHTAGFTGFTFLDLTAEMEKIISHWLKLGVRFDTCMTGYFGSAEQLSLLKNALPSLLSDKNITVFDPVMGDNGKLYSIYDDKFVAGMRMLCEGADYITPNMTEASLLAGVKYSSDEFDESRISEMVHIFAGMSIKSVVFTGVRFKDTIGTVAVRTADGKISVTKTPYVDTYLHGTGDIFASVFASLVTSGVSFEDAASKATDFTYKSICETLRTDIRYGLCFEPLLGLLGEYVNG